MEFNEFKNLIEDYITWIKKIENIGDVLNIDNMFELDWVNYASKLFDTILEKNFSLETASYITDKIFNLDINNSSICNELSDKDISKLWQEIN